MLLHPVQLQKRHDGIEARVARGGVELVQRIFRRKAAAFLLRAGIEPDDGVSDGVSITIQRDQRLRLSGDAYALQRIASAKAIQQFIDGGYGLFPVQLRRMFDEARLGIAVRPFAADHAQLAQIFIIERGL